MTVPPSLLPPILWVARLERRLEAWRRRARLLLLARELGDRLTLGEGTRCEPGVIWRVGDGGEVRLGPRCTVRTGAELKVDGILVVGARVLIGAGCTLSVLEAMELGDDCMLAERVSLRDHDHRFDDPATPVREQGFRVAPVRLGRDVWVGAGVTIMKGVTLGEGCVVGANAVVTRSFPAGSVLAGVPARQIAQRGAAPDAHVGS